MDDLIYESIMALQNVGGKRSEKSYKISDLYALFMSDGSFQFAWDKDIDGKVDESRLYSVFGGATIVEDSNRPPVWKNSWKDGYMVPVGKAMAIVLKASIIFPPRLVLTEEEYISHDDLLDAHRALVEMISSKPEVLDLYFGHVPYYDKSLVPAISRRLYDIEASGAGKDNQTKTGDKKDFPVDSLYGLFMGDCSFQFAVEEKRMLHGVVYIPRSVESGEELFYTHSISLRVGGFSRIFKGTVISTAAYRFLPPQLMENGVVSLNDLLEIQKIIGDLLKSHPELLDVYFPREIGKSDSKSEADSKRIEFAPKMKDE